VGWFGIDVGVVFELVDQFLLAAVPLFEQFLARGTASETGVDLAFVPHVRDVPRGDGVAFEIPDGFGGVREVVGEEPATVLLGESAGKAVLPAVVERAHVQELDFEQVAGLRAVDVDGPSQIVNLTEVDVSDVVGVVVVADLSAGPVEGLQSHRLAGVSLGDRRNVRMPAVERLGVGLFAWRTVYVDFECYFGH